ncbi:Gfo/Idh/MocA family protein [Magnetovibrio blakemorei]|uniref:Dehydrogenase n=1 Tax=Magnetovibrio blakemorei TaxID=28181 RepID=A0A1E5Q5Z9_9PROT|nr:Gfo/Idh/MocA family oxidoreductase [Magnetovibrio blakemorei]OEJ65854.1 dehydrogenase [Magnetovibrio blakemorei]OEJ66118.1 dehydrogenase [Magnetovibrio blakemorei]
MKVKVFGAGSIGNHLSHASRRLNWSVDLCDIDEAALKRTKNDIYPQRYTTWDEEIQLFSNNNAPKGGYDLIIIGTPPDTHISMALEALEENPKAILIEKPVCTPDLNGAQELLDKAKAKGIHLFVGYDHVVGPASDKVSELIKSGITGTIETIDVEFREYWGGIFNAHPWLDGPSDSYLGYWKRGGGASGEHSHAINLWQHFCHKAGVGRTIEVNGMLEYVNDGIVDYDKLCVLNLKTESGMVGRVVQDVVTNPPRKWGRIQGQNGYIEWHCGYKPGCDAVIHNSELNKEQINLFEKTRPDDFIAELHHIENLLSAKLDASPISYQKGLDTMLVVAAIHKSVKEGRTISIDYNKGYTEDSLS